MIARIVTGAPHIRPPQDHFRTRICSLQSDAIFSQAKRQARLQEFGDDEIEARLQTLVNCLESEADLHLKGRILARMHLIGLLANRLRLVHAWRNLPDLPSSPIKRPIFVTGMPRSGSTFLHDLFVQNHTNRAPLVWEVMSPPLAPRPESREVDWRIRRAARCLWWFRQIAPTAAAAHPITAVSPHECVAIHSHTLLSQEFTITFNIPGYTAYLDSVDLAPSYAWQKQFLQFLQFGSAPRQWVLKAPDHVFSLDALFKVFPDAVIIQMHRNPFDVLKSSLNLISELRQVFARAQPAEKTAGREACLLADGLDRISHFRDSHPELAERFFDIHYHELVAAPVEKVRGLHRQLDLPWTDEIAAQVQAFASGRTRYKRPKGSAAISRNIVQSTADAARFANYCTRFGISA